MLTGWSDVGEIYWWKKLYRLSIFWMLVKLYFGKNTISWEGKLPTEFLSFESRPHTKSVPDYVLSRYIHRTHMTRLHIHNHTFHQNNGFQRAIYRWNSHLHIGFSPIYILNQHPSPTLEQPWKPQLYHWNIRKYHFTHLNFWFYLRTILWEHFKKSLNWYTFRFFKKNTIKIFNYV